MSADNLDAANLAAALAQPGLIREDVVDTVYNLDEGIPTRFTDLVRSSTIDALYSEWTENDLNEVDTDNAKVDGSDAAGNDTKIGLRIGNRAQLSDKKVRISHAAGSVNSIGSVGRMAYQTSRRLMDLRRDIEAIATGRQGSVVDNGTTTAGRTGGFFAFLKSNASFGTNGAPGGFDLNTKVVTAPTPGDARGLTWELARDGMELVYNKGGFPSVLMSVPGAIKRINTFLFSNDGKPYRAEPHANVQGVSPATQTAQGFISVVLSDFGITLRLVDNRLQQTYDSADGSPVQVCDVGIIDPAHAGLGYLYGYRNDVLAKTGHADNRLLSNTWMVKVFREDAHANIADVDPTVAVTAGTPGQF